MRSTTITTDDEYVVLLDDAGHEVGRLAKADVHHDATPLHLGFSCYLFDDVGRALLTRRALGKADLARGLDQFVLWPSRPRRGGRGRGATARGARTRGAKP